MDDKHFVCVYPLKAEGTDRCPTIHSDKNDYDEGKLLFYYDDMASPGSLFRVVPGKGQPGSFWEDRGDRFHCGVDIYAPAMSEVHACETGEVIDLGTHRTSPGTGHLLGHNTVYPY